MFRRANWKITNIAVDSITLYKFLDSYCNLDSISVLISKIENYLKNQIFSLNTLKKWTINDTPVRKEMAKKCII